MISLAGEDGRLKGVEYWVLGRDVALCLQGLELGHVLIAGPLDALIG
jgi:hypothetical protein